MKKDTKTYRAKPQEQKAHKWHLIDAEGKVLGRLATKTAMILMGKIYPEYTPHVDLGDHVVIINSRKVKVTGNSKPEQKLYTHYTGYRAGLRQVSLKKMLEDKPNNVIKEAVRRMLPKTTLGRKLMKKLKVYEGAEHTHQAQQPVAVEA